MDRNQLYQDIAKRTQGDIYIGVVGPVRTGKSTFIKRFLDLLVLPQIENAFVRERIVDELPQSAAGRTIMTTQPKFVPNEAVRLDIGENESCQVRLVDCVGYLVPGAMGHTENGVARMVRTPWFDEDIPFEDAAEIGTRKVITEHSTLGVVVTTDGTISELPRESYIEAEARVIAEMQATGKPFVVIVNSIEPDGEAAEAVRRTIEERHHVTAISLNVMQMSAAEANTLLEEILLSFPLRLIELSVPAYMRALSADHWLLQRLMLPVLSVLNGMRCVRDYRVMAAALSNIEQFEPCRTLELRLGEGFARLALQPESTLFYEILSEQCGCDIHDDYQLISALKSFSAAKSEYDRVEQALNDAKTFGYGLVPPAIDEMELDEPMIVQQGNRFGVRLRAHASGLHVIRVDTDSEVNPIVGTEQQSEALVKYLTDTFAADPQAIWQTNIFGKPLYDLVREGMEGKANGMSEEVRVRMQAMLQRVVNDGCNNLICIML